MPIQSQSHSYSISVSSPYYATATTSTSTMTATSAYTYNYNISGVAVRPQITYPTDYSNWVVPAPADMIMYLDPNKILKDLIKPKQKYKQQEEFDV